MNEMIKAYTSQDWPWFNMGKQSINHFSSPSSHRSCYFLTIVGDDDNFFIVDNFVGVVLLATEGVREKAFKSCNLDHFQGVLPLLD